MRVVWLVAWRHLTSLPRQTALTVAGVGLGVAVFIFTVSMMDGLVVFFTQRLIRVSPLLTVLPERLDVGAARAALRHAVPGEVVALSRPPVPDQRPTVRGAVALAEVLRGQPHVAGVSVAAAVPAVLGFGAVAEPVTLTGLDAAAEAGVTNLPSMVTSGLWRKLSERRDGVVVGAQLASRLGVEVGDRLIAMGEQGRGRELEVVGIVTAGLGAVDEATAFVPLAAAQALAGFNAGEGTEIRIRTDRLTGLGPVRAAVEAVTGYRTETWQETSRASLKLFRTIGLTTYLLTGFVLVVAGLGIGNRLTTIILDKERDIAVIRSFGFARGTVRRIFLVEGLLMGAGGAAAGCAVAGAAIAFLTAHPIHFAPREGSVVRYTELFLANDPRYYLFISAAAVLIAAVAALLAVRRAVRVVPVEILRGSA